MEKKYFHSQNSFLLILFSLNIFFSLLFVVLSDFSFSSIFSPLVSLFYLRCLSIFFHIHSCVAAHYQVCFHPTDGPEHLQNADPVDHGTTNSNNQSPLHQTSFPSSNLSLFIMEFMRISLCVIINRIISFGRLSQWIPTVTTTCVLKAAAKVSAAVFANTSSLCPK